MKSVQRLLEDTGNITYQGQIKKWYDGYRFGKRRRFTVRGMYCVIV